MIYILQAYRKMTTRAPGISWLSNKNNQVTFKAKSKMAIAKKNDVTVGGLRYTGPKSFFLHIEMST